MKIVNSLKPTSVTLAESHPDPTPSMSQDVGDIEKGNSTLSTNTTQNEEPPFTPSTAKSQTDMSTSTRSQSSGRPLLGRGRKALRMSHGLTGFKMPSLKKSEPDIGARFKRRVRKIQDQHRGYQKLATFLDCEERFMVYRRFGYLGSRLLLEKQDELAKFERQLQGMEQDEFEVDDESLMTRRYLKEDQMKEKANLLRDIETTWNEYCVIVANASKMVSLNKPTSHEHKCVTTWFDNNKPLKAPEDQFIRHREDLISLRPGREYAWLDSGIETFLVFIKSTHIRRLFQSDDTFDKTDGSDGTILFTRSRIEKFVVSIITFFILILLIIPTYLLYVLTLHQSSSTSLRSICVLLVATLAFSASICLFTRAQRHEILAASAAYCAVLVVFIGNIGNNLSP